jgi:KDO2-lipid IV(A) lauroyltransferase
VVDRIVYWLFRLTILVTRPLSLRSGYWLASNVAALVYHVGFPRQRKALRANLARVLQSNDARFVDSVAERSFRNFGKYVIDFIRYPAITRDEVRARLRFDSWDALDEITASPRGAVMVTLHFGTWDLGAAALAAHDYPVHAIGESFRYPPMNELVQGSRERLGMRILSRERIGPAAMRTLRGGGMLAMLVDVAEEGNAIEVDFFGAPARVSSAPARIALRTNAWVVPATVVRGPDDETLICPRIDTSLRNFAPSGDDDRDTRELTGLIMRALEAPIREHPDQWFIFRPLWDKGGARA